MQSVSHRSLLAVVVCVCVSAIGALAQAGWWQVQTLIPGGDVGTFCSLALDPNGGPAMAYYDRLNGDLKYAWTDGSTWRFSVVDPEFYKGTQDTPPALAFLPSGLPAIVYTTGLSPEVRCARFDGAAWNVEVIGPGKHPSIAVLPSGNLALCYVKSTGTDYRLTFGQSDGTQWQWQMVESFTNSVGGTQSSLAVLPSGEPAISYADWSELKYAWRATGTWHMSVVDPNRPSSSDLAILPDGSPAIAYDLNKAVKYARWDGANWHIEPVHTGGTDVRLIPTGTDRPTISYRATVYPTYVSIAEFDGAAWQISTIADSLGNDYDLTRLPNDNLVACFATSRSLFCATRADGEWSRDAVDSPDTGGLATSGVILPNGETALAYLRGPSVWSGELCYAESYRGNWTHQSLGVTASGEGTGLVLLPNGNPLIAYKDQTFGDLMVASFDCAAWQHVAVDQSGNVGGYLSIVLLPSGEPAISYRDETNQNLKYAWSDGLNWHTTVVDAQDDVGIDTDLAILPSGQPAISYFDKTNAQAKYAWFDGDVWHNEAVGPCGDWGEFTSLAILPSGQPAVCYMRLSPDTYPNENLVYAAYSEGTWHETVVLATGRMANCPSLVVLPDGNPAICSRGIDSAVYYSWFNGAAWQTGTAMPDPGGPSHGNFLWNPLLIGPGGHPVIPCYDMGWAALRVVRRIPTGDMNCDGQIGFGDINPFIDALVSGEAAYYALHPNCNYLNADINGDGQVSFGDINPFVDLLIPPA